MARVTGQEWQVKSDKSIVTSQEKNSRVTSQE